MRGRCSAELPEPMSMFTKKGPKEVMKRIDDDDDGLNKQRLEDGIWAEGPLKRNFCQRRSQNRDRSRVGQ